MMDNHGAYDYVVVGAGTAGSVLARRLVDGSDCRVLVLEAGGPDYADAVHRTDIGSMTSLWGNADVTWPHVTTPQPNLNGRTIPVPQGKVLGGGSSVNAMMHVRGNRLDFDHWNYLGNEGWSHRDVVPYFRSSEDFDGGASEYRGVGGPLRVISYPEPSEVSQAFVAAAEELGFGAAGQDYNGAWQDEGAFFYQSARYDRDRRCSTADAYLRPVLANPNLTVLTGARACRVLIEGGRAFGVEYVRDGLLQRATVDGEVILACGAFASPQLLMLSGIGPVEHLRDNNIRAVVDLPGVGRNLQDHLLFGVGYESRREQKFPQLLAEAGLFTHTRPRCEAASPDLQFFFGPIQYVDETYRIDGPAFTFAPILARPQSRGTVTLRSKDPADLVVVDPHYLECSADLDVLVDAISLARELVGAKAFAPFRGRELAPGDEVRDRAGLVRYVRESASTVWHPVGTCKMGKDREAVVDSALRVHGVAGLRVADASIMPTITSGNTNAATIMIAEKAADMISAGRD
ncbi:GMC family oxidoreductase [Kutzneria chonburiensis]|uniref:GMC family oxidoreductase n=1 Tax=Kutzneria chonburiensis TaxID=1483604 RepID=A0ABV6MX52_9PSEU|nr:GMC family oxidoreductase N-terminal domain-containing protein [Kutzneria chonburiensis]